MIKLVTEGATLANKWKTLNLIIFKDATILDLKKLIFEKFNWEQQTSSVTLAFKGRIITNEIKHHQTLMDLSKKVSGIFKNPNVTPLCLNGKITCIFKKRSNMSINFRCFRKDDKTNKSYCLNNGPSFFIIGVPHNPSLQELKKILLKNI